MKTISALNDIHKKGLFGDHEDKSEKSITKISEIKDLLIIQIVQYKKSLISLDSLSVDGINIDDKPLQVYYNDKFRILWCGPKNWILISTNKDLLSNIKKIFNEEDFAITDLSHSKAIIEIEGNKSIEILKKGCPFNFNDLKKNKCVNSIFNGITVTIDMIDDNPSKVRIFTLRSFGESLYHSITDSSLEFGYKAL